MQNIGLAWLVIQLSHHSALAVGTLAFCRFVPFTVFGLVAGVVADRFDNRRLVIGTQTTSMLLSPLLAALALPERRRCPSSTCSPSSSAPRRSSTRPAARR